ncbi:phosphopentomutase [Angelakisella massiliensis]|uniref:phosphopentomutase n=1 Tax=Angelakisella massiliensis TaxID=1871018 RepID=UPI0023A8F39A|nr:phosphopentomutase [Angelakisella massiliensis]
MAKRVFLIVLDSVGIGEMPDSAEYGDEGSNTLAACYRSGQLSVPRMETMGLFNIQGVGCGQPTAHPTAAFGRLAEASKGKDTTIGHWEIAGIISPRPLPTYPEGFPQEILDQLSARTGRKILCNKPYSGTEVLKDYGPEHMRTGDLIVYTSADSVMQIAAHEEVIPVEELYRICGIAREIMQGEHGVGRIIARPFVGEAGAFTRTANRHDFSLTPPGTTMLDLISAAGLASIGVGKIYDIFAGKGITEFVRTKSNRDGMERTIEYADKDFEGLCFVNLVDFDMVYGHRNNVPGYTAALNEFDGQLGDLLEHLREEDLLLITADHGCDPSTPSTDHSREHTPVLLYGKNIREGVDLKTRTGFCDIAATVLEYLGLPVEVEGKSFLSQVIK